MVFSAGYYEQKHIYTAWGERMEQLTERGSWDRLLYVHEDIMGNTRYYTKDNGNFAAAVFTGHPYDTVLDIYFAEARFYDANHRQWMASDPIKSGLNWYLYVEANPGTYFDPTGLMKVEELRALYKAYSSGILPKEAVAQIVIMRNAFDIGISVADWIYRTSEDLYDALNKAEKKAIKGFPSEKKFLTALFLSHHEITQILAGGDLTKEYNSDVVLERPVGNAKEGKDNYGELDIADITMNTFYEVKPKYTNPIEWKEQVKKYERISSFKRGRSKLIGKMPLIYGDVLLYQWGICSVYLEYETTEDGKIAYFFTLRCKKVEDDDRETRIERKNGEVTNAFLWEYNKRKPQISEEQVAEEFIRIYALQNNLEKAKSAALKSAAVVLGVGMTMEVGVQVALSYAATHIALETINAVVGAAIEAGTPAASMEAAITLSAGNGNNIIYLQKAIEAAALYVASAA